MKTALSWDQTGQRHRGVDEPVSTHLHLAPDQLLHRHDAPVDLLTRHTLGAMETAIRDWAEGRVDDPLTHLRLLLGLGFHRAAGH